MSLEHHVKLADRPPVGLATGGAFKTERAKLFGGDGLGKATCEFVGAETPVTVLALDERVGKSSGMARGDPSFRVHEDGCVDAIDVVAFFYPKTPPSVHDILFKHNAERAEIPGAGEAAINVGAGKDKPAALT